MRRKLLLVLALLALWPAPCTVAPIPAAVPSPAATQMS